MSGWHHRLNGHEFDSTLGVGDGQGGLACCDSWGHKESDTTERLNWTELNNKGNEDQWWANLKYFSSYPLLIHMTPVGFNFLNSAIQALDLIISNTSQIPHFHEDFLCEIIQWPQLNTGNTEFNIRKQVVNKYLLYHAKNITWKWREINSSLLTVLQIIRFMELEFRSPLWASRSAYCFAPAMEVSVYHHNLEDGASTDGLPHLWLRSGHPTVRRTRAPLLSFQYYYFQKNYLLVIILGLLVRWNVWITLEYALLNLVQAEGTRDTDILFFFFVFRVKTQL